MKVACCHCIPLQPRPLCNWEQASSHRGLSSLCLLRPSHWGCTWSGGWPGKNSSAMYAPTHTPAAVAAAKRPPMPFRPLGAPSAASAANPATTCDPLPEEPLRPHANGHGHDSRKLSRWHASSTLKPTSHQQPGGPVLLAGEARAVDGSVVGVAGRDVTLVPQPGAQPQRQVWTPCTTLQHVRRLFSKASFRTAATVAEAEQRPH